MFHLMPQLLLLLLMYFFSVLILLVGTVVAQGFATRTVCNGTAADATVLLENGTTYVVRDCTITMLFITDDNNSMYLLHDVAIVVRGGSALAVVVRAVTVRNVTMDISDVVYDAATATTTAMNTQVLFFDQIVTAENISISLTNVQIYNALDVSIVNATVSQTLHGLSVALVNCTLRNVTTSGLIAVSGNQNTTTASSLSLAVDGGTYSLLFIPGSSDGVMIELKGFASLSNAVLVARNGVAIQVVAVSNRTVGIGVSIVVNVHYVHTASVVHILIERADLAALPSQGFSVARIQSIDVSLTESSVSFRHSRLTSQSASPSGLELTAIRLVESVNIEVMNTSIELIAHGMQRLTDPRGTSLAQGVGSAAISVGPINRVVDSTVVISDCYLRLVAMNMSSLQNYSTVTCAAVLWNSVVNTSALVVNVTRVIVNLTAHEASVAMFLSPYVPVVGLLSLIVAGFAAVASVLERSIVSIEYSALFSDVIVITPAVPAAAYPLLVGPLLKADVSVALVMSTSDWNNSNISVHMSRVVVQQLRFLLQSPAFTVSVGGTSNYCDAIHVTNSTGVILFHDDPEGFKRCLPALVTAILPLQYLTKITLTAVRLDVGDCDIVVAIRDEAIVKNQHIQPQLFIATIFLPAAVIDVLISISNVSSVGLSSMRTGPVIALSGTVVAGLNATLTRVTGFPLGMVWSDLEAGSTIQSSNILAIAVDADEGGVVAGNVTAAAAALTVTLRNCVLGGGLFGDNSTRWLAASYDSAMTTPSSVIVLQECNMWNGRHLTLPLARRLLREAHNSVPPGAVTVRMGDENNGNCVVTATLEVIRPLPMPRVSSMTGAVAVAAMALSAISAPSTASVASMMRLQAIFGSLRVGRRCYQATSGGAATNDDSSSSSESDDVGSAVFDNPLQLSIPVQDTSLQYAAGCATGNTILFLVAMIVLNLHIVPSTSTSCQRSFHHVLDHIPGNAFTVMLLLLTPTVTSGTVLSSASTMLGGVACVVAYGFGSIASIVLMLWRFPLRSVLCKQRQGCHATMFVMITALQRWLFAETHGWVPSREALQSLLNPVTFRHRFGVLFVGYRSGCHWYAAVDVAVPVLTGVLCGLPSGSVSCSLVLYVLLGLSVVACMGSVLLRPCMTRWDNVCAMVGNGFSLVVTALIVAVRMDAANTVTTALAWMSLVPTLTSVSQLLYRLYLTCTTAAHRNNVAADSLEVMVVSPDRNRRRHVDGSARDALCPGSPHDTLLSIVDVERKKSANESLLLLLSLICTNKRHV